MHTFGFSRAAALVLMLTAACGSSTQPPDASTTHDEATRGEGLVDASALSPDGEGPQVPDADSGEPARDTDLSHADGGPDLLDSGVLPDDDDANGSECLGQDHAVDIEVRNAADLARLAGARCINGTLTFRRGPAETSPAPSGNLPDLRAVSGNVTFAIYDGSEPPRAEALEEVGGTLSLGTAKAIQLPALRVVGSLILESAFGSGSAPIELPSLETVRDDISTRVANRLEVLSLPVLAQVGGDVSLRYASSLKALSAPKLRVVAGSLRIDQATVLEALHLPALERVGSLSVMGRDDTDALRRVELGVLTEVRGDAYVSSSTVDTVDLAQLRQVDGGLTFAYPKRLPALRLPALEHAERFVLGGATVLSTLEMPNLSWISAGLVSNCPLLSECALVEINARLEEDSAKLTASDLLSDESCVHSARE